MGNILCDLASTSFSLYPRDGQLLHSPLQSFLVACSEHEAIPSHMVEHAFFAYHTLRKHDGNSQNDLEEPSHLIRILTKHEFDHILSKCALRNSRGNDSNAKLWSLLSYNRKRENVTNLKQTKNESKLLASHQLKQQRDSHKSKKKLNRKTILKMNVSKAKRCKSSIRHTNQSDMNEHRRSIQPETLIQSDDGVDALRLMTLLALFSDADAESRLGLILQLFDWDHIDALTTGQLYGCLLVTLNCVALACNLNVCQMHLDPIDLQIAVHDAIRVCGNCVDAGTGQRMRIRCRDLTPWILQSSEGALIFILTQRWRHDLQHLENNVEYAKRNVLQVWCPRMTIVVNTRSQYLNYFKDLADTMDALIATTVYEISRQELYDRKVVDSVMEDISRRCELEAKSQSISKTKPCVKQEEDVNDEIA